MFRYSADRLPVLTLLAIAALDFSAYLYLDHWFLLAAYAGLSMYPKAFSCAYNHHHQHLAIFTHWVPNRLIELVFALQTGITGNTWVLHHSLGHHINYLDQKKDESRWMRDDGTRMGEWEYAFKTALTAYPRAWEVGKRFPKQRRVMALMSALTVAMVAGLIAYRPLAGFLIFVVTPLSLVVGTALATYFHHSERPTDNHFVASNNILQKFYNVLTLNLGYHTAHHYKPGVHWSLLPKLHAEIQDRIPLVAYAEPGMPWRLFGESLRPAHVPPPAKVVEVTKEDSHAEGFGMVSEA